MIQTLPDDTVCTRLWDVCIIGSGAMGIALARTLSTAGKTVLVIEAGSEDITEESQDFYACRAVGHPNDGSSNGRFRVFGGSTERWGGQAMRFEEVDFKPRPEIFPQGWPIGREEVSAFYEQAENMMGVPDPQYHAFRQELEKTAAKFGVSAPMFREATRSFHLHSSVFTSRPRLREVYREELTHSRNMVVVQNSPATRLVMENGAVSALEIIPKGGAPRTVAAQAYVLAGGCVENARFLLLQRDVFHNEPLKRLPTLGCFLQDHPGAHLGEVDFTRGAFLQDSFRLKKHGGMSYKARMSWSNEKREAEKLMAVSGTLLMMRNKSDFDDSSPEQGSRMESVPAKASQWVRALKLLANGFITSPIHRTYLAVSAEDLRDEASRISLSNTEQDALGFPRAVVDWRVSLRVAESIMAYTEEFENFLRTCAWGRLRRFSFMGDAESLRRRLTDNSHPIGATCMGSGPESGVVDRDSKVFGIPNLFVSGTSVLPTGSHANPTLTALALAIRLGHHLSKVDVAHS